MREEMHINEILKKKKTLDIITKMCYNGTVTMREDRMNVD